MDAEHRWLAKTEPGAGGRPASVEKGLGRDHFSFSYSQAIVYLPRTELTGAAVSLPWPAGVQAQVFLDLTNLARVLQVSLGVCFLSCRRWAPRAQSALPGPCLTSLTIIFFFAAKAHMQIATMQTMKTQITTTPISTGESIAW